MTWEELQREMLFGLENLEKVYQHIYSFSRMELPKDARISALAYECQGYYNGRFDSIITFYRIKKVVLNNNM